MRSELEVRKFKKFTKKWLLLIRSLRFYSTCPRMILRNWDIPILPQQSSVFVTVMFILKAVTTEFSAKSTFTAMTKKIRRPVKKDKILCFDFLSLLGYNESTEDLFLLFGGVA